jgi:hypothetical protein
MAYRQGGEGADVCPGEHAARHPRSSFEDEWALAALQQVGGSGKADWTGTYDDDWQGLRIHG